LRAVEAVFDTISAALKRGDEVRLVRLRHLTCSRRKALDGPQPAHRRADADQGIHPAKFKAGKGLKDSVNL